MTSALELSDGEHAALDWLCAWDHPLVGSDGVRVRLDRYHRAPQASFFLEATINVPLVIYFVVARRQAGRPIPKAWTAVLLLGFRLGYFMFYALATTSLGGLLGR